jgi:hypothetical protein
MRKSAHNEINAVTAAGTLSKEIKALWSIIGISKSYCSAISKQFLHPIFVEIMT